MKRIWWAVLALACVALLITGCVPTETPGPGTKPPPVKTEKPPVETEVPPTVKACDSKYAVDFESQVVGQQYFVSDSFVENGVTVSFEPFEWGNGTPTAGGVGEIGTGGMAGGSGNELGVNNINVRFIFPCPIKGLSLLFGEYGGNLNIEINGDFRNFEDFADIDGMVIGGVTVSVPVGGFGNDQGKLVLDGEIRSFSIGGQEFWIDDLCPILDNCEVCVFERCVDFESQAVGTQYKVGDWFEENGVIISFESFVWDNGTPTADGYAEIQNDLLAGGSGNDLWFNNINARFVFPCPLESLSLRFGAYGGNLNIEINGDFRNFGTFADIDGMVIGGVQVTVIPLASTSGGDQGILVLKGVIHSFSIGGQELAIDDVCPYVVEE